MRVSNLAKKAIGQQTRRGGKTTHPSTTRHRLAATPRKMMLLRNMQGDTHLLVLTGTHIPTYTHMRTHLVLQPHCCKSRSSADIHTYLDTQSTLSFWRTKDLEGSSPCSGCPCQPPPPSPQPCFLLLLFPLPLLPPSLTQPSHHYILRTLAAKPQPDPTTSSTVSPAGNWGKRRRQCG